MTSCLSHQNVLNLFNSIKLQLNNVVIKLVNHIFKHNQFECENNIDI